MSRYRPIECYIWNDDKFPYASDDCQLVWFHCFTNPLSTPIGLYKASVAGLAEEKNLNGSWPLARYLKGFREALAKGFLEHDEKALLIYFPNFFQVERQGNHPQSPNVVTSWGKLWNELPESTLKHKCYQSLKALLEGLAKDFRKDFRKAFYEAFSKPLPIQDQEQDQDQEQEKRLLSGSDKPDVARGILTYLNSKTGHQYRPEKTNIALIQARLSSATVEQIHSVIDAKVAEWKADPKMRQYLRPSTLFRASNFEQYLGQVNNGQPSTGSRPADRSAWEGLKPGKVKL